MRDPWSTFRSLPWRSLLLSAIATLAAVYAVEILLLVAARANPLVRDLWKVLFGPPLGLIFSFSIAVGIGVLSTFVLDRLGRVYPSTTNLWGYVLCLAGAIVVHDMLPAYANLISFSFVTLIAIILGVFVRYRSS